ncbi:class II glutamine amidotransferase [Shewanella sp. D64]|uniref:class II glutamine amidotransferase n=1 Tax=unclassified Shewanella TaxID=196818 RepID=UPI0022BA5B06|nr:MULTISPECIES: class II glutamine amidotransferase [unclassified Shewanella]MEC4725116.1 class II glutamine amidotransferase [Shewanella sp. D64]MEC4737017.1 class II glutamine amidotransferase [Shewanella sp. E94]WBJ96605.1 class II glutamine amidotransferase [Shewanella sp. MTB7]
MCRFLTYRGPATVMSPLIFQAENSLVSQSKFSQKRKIPINADGFGLGWYPIQDDPIPATFVNVDPAWSNRNLKMIGDKVQTHHYFAHVRDASVGMPVSQANCHPFQCMHYLWMHNGRLDLFDSFRRTLLNSLSDRAFSLIKGNTDSEYAFALFMDQLKFNPKASLIQLEVAMVATIEKIMQIRKLCGANTNAFINFAVTDGVNTIVTRFATLESAQPASLFYGTGSLSCIEGVVRITPTDDKSKMCMIVCSEPLTDDINIWKKVERNHLVSVTHDHKITQKPIPLPYQTI